MEIFVFFTQISPGLEKLGIQHSNLDFAEHRLLTFKGNSICMLVYDRLSIDEFREKLADKLNNLAGLVKLYCIRHSLPGIEIIEALQNYCQVNKIQFILPEKPDEHEKATSKSYIHLSKLDFDNFTFSDDQVNILKAELDGDTVLEAKLELLHKCLLPSDAPDALPAILNTAKESDKYSAAYSVFVEQRNKCPKNTEGYFIDDDVDNGLFSKEYIEALTEFRKALLGS